MPKHLPKTELTNDFKLQHPAKSLTPNEQAMMAATETYDALYAIRRAKSYLEAIHETKIRVGQAERNSEPFVTVKFGLLETQLEEALRLYFPGWHGALDNALTDFDNDGGI